MEYLIKIIKSFEKSGILIKGINEPIKDEKKGGFLPTLFGILGT